MLLIFQKYEELSAIYLVVTYDNLNTSTLQTNWLTSHPLSHHFSPRTDSSGTVWMTSLGSIFSRVKSTSTLIGDCRISHFLSSSDKRWPTTLTTSHYRKTYAMSERSRAPPTLRQTQIPVQKCPAEMSIPAGSTSPAFSPTEPTRVWCNRPPHFWWEVSVWFVFEMVSRKRKRKSYVFYFASQAIPNTLYFWGEIVRNKYSKTPHQI